MNQLLPFPAKPVVASLQADLSSARMIELRIWMHHQNV
jgi:hypothetical protein